MDKYQQIQKSIRLFLGSKIYPRWKTDTIHSDSNSKLYRRVHKSSGIDKKTGMPNGQAFKDFSQSYDWSEHTTPLDILNLVSKQFKTDKKAFKNKEEYCVYSIIVKELNNLDITKNILHDPVQYFPEYYGEPNNRAHTLVVFKDIYKEDSKTNDTYKQEKVSVKIRSIMIDKCKLEKIENT